MVMPQIDYDHARERLKKACQHYSLHKERQLWSLVGVSRETSDSFFYERALGTETSGIGFLCWISCKYAYLFEQIALLNTKFNFRGNSSGINYYEMIYPPCKNKIIFYDDALWDTQQNRDMTDSQILLDKLNVLNGLLLFIMVDQNKEPDFEERWDKYRVDANEHHICLGSDPISVQLYKSLMKLKSLISFVSTLPEYSQQSSYVLREFNTWLPTLENYRKGLVAEEFDSILSDDKLSAEEALNAVALQLKNPITSELLAINQQSETECFLKRLCVILVLVGIGVLPTLLLASKRLYDTGGTSINFFKSLSQNLVEDIEDVTSHLTPSKPQ